MKNIIILFFVLVISGVVATVYFDPPSRYYYLVGTIIGIAMLAFIAWRYDRESRSHFVVLIHRTRNWFYEVGEVPEGHEVVLIADGWKFRRCWISLSKRTEVGSSSRYRPTYEIAPIAKGETG